MPPTPNVLVLNKVRCVHRGESMNLGGWGLSGSSRRWREKLNLENIHRLARRKVGSQSEMNMTVWEGRSSSGFANRVGNSITVSKRILCSCCSCCSCCCRGPWWGSAMGVRSFRIGTRGFQGLSHRSIITRACRATGKKAARPEGCWACSCSGVRAITSPSRSSNGTSCWGSLENRMKPSLDTSGGERWLVAQKGTVVANSDCKLQSSL
mmetsp:Transcript_6070/g.14802  ORF Transcript_6070/g.14802 Transcript_6070/m.14802 type:complete len:209 (-) Transcript_6070:6414-7040(-)